MQYEPKNRSHRETLAQEILELMKYAKFEEETSKGERVFSRHIHPQLRVMVYTSIVGKEVREKDADALRVCGVYTNKKGEERGIVKSSRVYRTGQLEDILERLLKRMREVWRKSKNAEKCPKCGAPQFTSKKGNLVCCEICFAKDENGTT